MGYSCPSLISEQDLDTMEENSEIKIETNISEMTWIQSSMSAGRKKISKALSYITGEMKECGESLKGTVP
jgi:solute carrier family 14 (urea transporter)